MCCARGLSSPSYPIMYLLRKINSLCNEAYDTKHTIIKARFASEIENEFFKK